MIWYDMIWYDILSNKQTMVTLILNIEIFKTKILSSTQQVEVEYVDYETYKYKKMIMITLITTKCVWK